jgi:predicted RNase H-like HicB family nuclease
MKDRYLYPAVFTEDQDGVAVEFPDLPGCFTCADTLEEAYDMAREALGLHLYGLEEDGEQIPTPAKPRDLMSRLTHGQSVVVIEVWMPPIRGGVENKAVKKTLTLPKWLNELAERQNVNFSQVLQDALKAHLGILPNRPGAPSNRKETTAALERWSLHEPIAAPDRAKRPAKGPAK